MSVFPPLVQRLLEQLKVDPQHVAVLSFSDRWELQTQAGALALLGLDGLDQAALSTSFREMCIGLSRLRGTHLPQVEIPSGSVVDLHLVAEATLFHAVLIDVRDSVESARVAQQTLQNLKLEVMARTREVVETRQKLSATRQRNVELQRQLLVQQQAAASVRAQLAALHVELLRELEQVSVRVSKESGALLPSKRALAVGQRLPNLLAQLNAAPLLLAGNAPPRERLDLEQLAAVCIDSATQMARERGLGFELRVNRRSTETPLLNSALLRVLYSAAMAQAMYRCSAGQRVDAEIRWDGSGLKLEVTAPVPAFTEVQRACLWELQIADPTDAVQACLLAAGCLLRHAGGRATADALNPATQRLTISVAQAARDGEVTERLFSGGRVWLLGGSEAQVALAQQRLTDLGFEFEQVEAEGLNAAALRQVPDAVLIDTQLEDAVRLAFQLKGRGYRGRILALGSPIDSPVARASFDATVAPAMEPDQLVRAIRGPGG